MSHSLGQGRPGRCRQNRIMFRFAGKIFGMLIITGIAFYVYLQHFAFRVILNLHHITNGRVKKWDEMLFYTCSKHLPILSAYIQKSLVKRFWKSMAAHLNKHDSSLGWLKVFAKHC